MAHKREESGDTKCFVTVSNDFEINGVVVEENAEPRNYRIHGDHEQDSNDAGKRQRNDQFVARYLLQRGPRTVGSNSLSLLNRFAIVHGMC